MGFVEFAGVMVASIWVFLIADIAEKPNSKGFVKSAFWAFVTIEIGILPDIVTALGGLI